ncbi:helicase with zinc finger domain 2 [Protopterus annectens]|uniref:helicase with zinc finger domain 2 n=1 Tax=Protopterus annectens TaxID=7888 RepID=UPI001CFA4E8A|nr:helicase with zinc finger domain 2 [Protopterus annectens]
MAVSRLTLTDNTLLQDLLNIVDLHLACFQCAQKENESTYVFNDIAHACKYELLLARKRNDKSGKWRYVRRHPEFQRLTTYEVCWYYRPSSGCKKHRNKCTFAWSEEEAIIWSFEKKHNLQSGLLKKMVLMTRKCSNKQLTSAEEILCIYEGEFQEVCSICFYGRPQKIAFLASDNFCTVSARHIWKPLLVHLLKEGNSTQYNEIRPASNTNCLSYCRYIAKNVLCQDGAKECRYAHSEVEKAVWQAEKSGLNRQDLIPSHKRTELIVQECSTVQLYCRVCLVTFSSQESFKNHCASLEHALTISSDTCVEWHYRTPPLGNTALVLCDRGDRCDFGDDCTSAHSEEELHEWLQRKQTGKANRKVAEKTGLLSYQERLLREYKSCSNEVLIMSESIDGISVSSDQSLRVQTDDIHAKLKWNFRLQSEHQLMHVALLKRQPGAIFYLPGKGLSKNQTFADGARFLQDHTIFNVGIHFEAFSYGIYEQWVVFDFGSYPVLLQKIQVVIGQAEVQRGLYNSKGVLGYKNSTRWHSGNRKIIPCVDKMEQDVELLKRYKAPLLSLEYKCNSAETGPFTRQNYRQKMHSFLYTEELAEEDVLARLNLQTSVSFNIMVSSPSFGMLIAPEGELYAEVPLLCNLTLHSKEGYLLKRSVKTALITTSPPLDEQVYEVIVCSELITEEHIYLKLSKRCCTELGLMKEKCCMLEIQFQLERLPFCYWHEAVDLLPQEILVLPDIAACCLPKLGKVTSEVNQKQKSAVSFVTGLTAGVRPVPPLVIYGPFGTGKTFTLAMAAVEALKQTHTKVLICTHTNSAADMYIREYFHPHVTSGHPEAVPLRIKVDLKSASSTDDITLMYCLLSEDKKKFMYPNRETVHSHRIIVTTTMAARFLQILKLPCNYFSHILLDEASQMLECEALVPLALAGDRTRVVLAGDHMQMTPKLFSIDDSKSANYTLLNRLFHYYQNENHETALKSRIVFTENYRSTKAIIDFVSKHFYVGKGDVIQARGNILPHPDDYPLMFCHVYGSCTFDTNSLSWFNVTEVVQVVDKVREIYRKWPPEWGPLELKSICVLSEGMQVHMIRQELRKQDFGQVTVENVHNIQGRQFRVIIISMVQTSQSLPTADNTNLEFFNDPRVLNTAMTRAQFQIIVVGDATAVCCFGRCSNIWKKYIQECIKNESIYPDDLSIEQVKESVADAERWRRKNRTAELEEESDSDSWTDEAETFTNDSILLELLDENKHMMVMVSEEGLLNVVKEAAQTRKELYVNFPVATLSHLLKVKPNVYKRCQLFLEDYLKGYGATLDDDPPFQIKLRGRINCGMAFPGDQVLVEILPGPVKENNSSCHSGRVVGVLKKAETTRIFVCTIDEYDFQVMTPIDKCIIKIFIAGCKKNPNMLPIQKCHKGKIVTHKYEKITEEFKNNNVFIVEVLNWRGRFYFPVGIVTEVLPIALTIEQGIRILDLEFQVQKSLNKEHFRHASTGIYQGTENRIDCRSYFTFTVDPKGSKDLDDAISVRQLEKCYEIGIHISDVSDYVQKGSTIDIEAQKRSATYYTTDKDPLHMLPAMLSEDLCSLLPGKDRNVISLFIRVEENTHKMASVTFALSQICSDWHLTYEEAEDVIKNFGGNELKCDTPENCLAVVYHFSRVHRKCRLQEDSFYEQIREDQQLCYRRSHLMVEELMIMFNSFVAEYLSNTEGIKMTLPIRLQDAPNPLQVSQLVKKHSDLISLSIHLSHHMSDYSQDALTPGNGEFLLLIEVWKQIVSAAYNMDSYKMVELIATDDIHPKLVHIAFEFRKLLTKSLVLRSNSNALSKVGHYSLQTSYYTWASSPIRRYIDIIVQRLLHSALCKKTGEYTETEIDVLCNDFSKKYSKASAYENKSNKIHLAIQLKSQVVQKIVFVINVEPTEKHFAVLFPFNRDSIPQHVKILYRSLQLKDQPLHNKEAGFITLSWRRRIYSLENFRLCYEERDLFSPHVMAVSAASWRNVLEAIKKEDFHKVSSLIARMHESGLLHRKCIGRIIKSQCFHYTEISLRLRIADAFQVQLTSCAVRGFLMPTVQLLSVAPEYEVCLEHAERPIVCFTKYAVHSTKESYRDVSEYQKIWGPLCEMESVSSALSENESVILRDLEVHWKQERKSGRPIQGHFSMPGDFKVACSIDYDFRNCYFCIRCENVKELTNQENNSHCENISGCNVPTKVAQNPEVCVDPKTFTWVAHGRTGITEDSDKRNAEKSADCRVNLCVHFTSMEKVPAEVYQDHRKFTLELIPKLLPDVRQENAVQTLHKASALTMSIALGHEVPEILETSSILKQKNFNIRQTDLGFHPLNPSQNAAVRAAIANPFTLIQGPPGTGKTIVGVHIVYWFYMLNKELTNRTPPQMNEGDIKEKCIMYCGPSNKSVDVVAEYLLKLKSVLKPLRVYSEQIEMLDFPYPGSNLHLSQKTLREGKPMESLRAITLHYRIRMPSNPHHHEIVKFDAMVKRGDIIPEEDVLRYKQLLNKARNYELKRHDVILCTCSTSYSMKSAGSQDEAINVTQILIDECSMCSEPETLIPLVHHRKAKKIVFLGDHKQLCPIIQNDVCKNLGMARSLFERYKEQAIMLDIQYRMHEDICDFPSKEFYYGRLKTDPQLANRPPSVFYHPKNKSCPIVFGHVEGKELSLVVSTEEGNENSKGNMEEVAHVVRIAKWLTLNGTITPDSIGILTPYNAQVHEIKQQLWKEGVPEITVCTIAKSQGSEWRYVILSTVRSSTRTEVEVNPTKRWLRKNLGFVIDPNIVNVAITRAKEGLCIVGDRYLLNCSRLWERLLRHYESKRCLVPASQIGVRR